MKKLLIRSAALVMTAVLLLCCMGCAAVTEKLDAIFKEGTETTGQDLQTEPEIEMPPKVKETYTFLITTQAVEASKPDHVMLVTFRTAVPSISILQLPTDLYLHVSEQSVEGLFQKRYEASVKDGHTEKEAAAAASEALADVLATGFNTPIDYYINFSASQLAGLVNTLGGVEMTVPFTMGGLSIGRQTLNGSQALEYLAYDAYSSMPQSYMDARKLLTAAIFDRVKEMVKSENLSLFVGELRSTMTTNLPPSENGGEDIFFVRKWLQTDPDAFRISNLSTQIVYITSSASRVLLEGNTVKQMNELMEIYEEDLTAEQFDPRYVFVDYSSDVAKAVYNSTASMPATYTAKQLFEGALTLNK